MPAGKYIDPICCKWADDANNNRRKKKNDANDLQNTQKQTFVYIQK